MNESLMHKEAMFNTLIRIMELELAGAVRNTDYALMVRGFSRLPIVAWLNRQSEQGPVHARPAGEPFAWLGSQPSPAIGPLPESAKHHSGNLPRASPDQEREILKAYYDLLDLSKDKNMRLEEYARDMIAKGLARRGEADRMSMQRPGLARRIPRARLQLCR
jgi:bacterioferritin